MAFALTAGTGFCVARFFLCCSGEHSGCRAQFLTDCSAVRPTMLPDLVRMASDGPAGSSRSVLRSTGGLRMHGTAQHASIAASPAVLLAELAYQRPGCLRSRCSSRVGPRARVRMPGPMGNGCKQTRNFVKRVLTMPLQEFRRETA